MVSIHPGQDGQNVAVRVVKVRACEQDHVKVLNRLMEVVHVVAHQKNLNHALCKTVLVKISLC